MVKFFPEHAYIAEMKPTPTEGERFLLNFLRDYLGEMNGNFEVFFHARLSEGFADVVVVRKNYGILLIKVADCDSDSLNTPVGEAKQLKNSFCDVCRIRSHMKNELPIQTAVFFHGTTAEQVKNFFGFVGDNDTILLYNYVLLLTADGLQRNGLQHLPKTNFLIGDRVSAVFTDDIYDEICRDVKPFGEINYADELPAEQRKRLEPLLSGGNPNVKFFPELAELPHIRPLPTEGELFLLKFLRDYLGRQKGNYEVFFQAHWDGLKPDIVVLRKNHGILIIEVKDWNLDLYTFDDMRTWTLKKDDSYLKSPVEQANFYKKLFYNTYSRSLAEKKLHNRKIFSLVQTAVFFYGATQAQVERIPTDGYVVLLTREELEQNGLNCLRYGNYFFGDTATDFFSDDVYDELCRVLKPSEHSRSKIFFPAELTKKQRELSKSVSGMRQQLKGPAGSGKTTVLAFRAVDAFRKTNKPVLILTFNITLCHYIRDCINHALNSVSGIEGRKNRIKDGFFTVVHFHEFINGYRAKHDLITILDKDGNDTYKLPVVPKKFQTIFVDETQDFERGWLETVWKLLAPDGELIFFGDKEQDLYQRHTNDDKSDRHKLVVPGVIGRPLELKGTRRLRTKILDLARAFQIEFFDGSKDNEIELPDEQSLFDEYPDDKTTVRYEFFDSFDANKIVAIFKDVLAEFKPPNDDICIMSHLIHNVRPVDKILRDSGYPTTTTFEREEDWQVLRSDKRALDELRRVAKHSFWMEGGKIKLSTIHSYKGWGIHTEILIIGNDFETFDDGEFLNSEMLYTGITRAKKNLIVINFGNVKYDKFFRTALEKTPTQQPVNRTVLASQKVDEAWKLYDSGNFSDAIKLLDEAIELNPNYAEAYYNRGAAYNKLGQYERAIADFQKYIELKPEDAASAYTRLAQCYQSLAATK